MPYLMRRNIVFLFCVTSVPRVSPNESLGVGWIEFLKNSHSVRKKSGQGSSLTHARGHSRSSLTVPRGLVSSCLTIARDLLCSRLTVARDLLQCSLTVSRSFLRESKILFKEVHFRSISKSREYVFYEINPP